MGGRKADALLVLLTDWFEDFHEWHLTGNPHDDADRIRLSMDGGLNLDGEIIQARGAVSIDTTESLRFLRL